MTILQVLALVCFLCAAVLAYFGTTRPRYANVWAVLVSLGLALWLVSTTSVGK